MPETEIMINTTLLNKETSTAQQCVIFNVFPINQGTHTHTHTFNGPFSRTTWVSRYQKGKTNLDFSEARDGEWQWHQLGHMRGMSAPCSRKPRQHPTAQFFTSRMPFLPPNQQRQSTEGRKLHTHTPV